MNSLFQVNYIVKTTGTSDGEYSPIQQITNYSFLSLSNDLNEIFTDLFDKHRFEGIIGIEIISVLEKQANAYLRELIDIIHHN